MKKVIYISSIILIVLALVLCSCCQKETAKNENSNSSKMILHIENGDNSKTFELSNSEIENKTLIEILDYKNISYELGGDSGVFESIDSLESDISQFKYVTIFTNVEKDQANSATTLVKNYNGTVLKEIAVDVNKLTINTNTIIYISLEER